MKFIIYFKGRNRINRRREKKVKKKNNCKNYYTIVQKYNIIVQNTIISTKVFVEYVKILSNHLTVYRSDSRYWKHKSSTGWTGNIENTYYNSTRLFSFLFKS
jgi:hypothetical protein